MESKADKFILLEDIVDYTVDYLHSIEKDELPGCDV